MVSTSVDIPEDATYEEALAVVETRLYNGARVTPEWLGLKKVAEIRDEDRNLVTEAQTTHGDIIDDLKECNPGVPPWAFEPRTTDAKTWTGIHESWAKETTFDPADWDDRGRIVISLLSTEGIETSSNALIIDFDTEIPPLLLEVRVDVHARRAGEVRQ